MGQGNPLALKRTIDSFSGLCNEVIFGDLLVFEHDREVISGYGCKMVRLGFNHIYEHGFADILNILADHASNEWVIYMNVGEVIDEGDIIANFMTDQTRHNCFYFNHKEDPHQWIRCYRKSQLKWSGPIHEEVVGSKNPAPSILFTMKDTEKDMEDTFKANVYNEIKDLVYTRQYCRIMEEPDKIGACNEGWLKWAREQDPPMRTRLESNLFYEAFEKGDFNMMMNAAIEHLDTSELKHVSSKLINFQGRRLDVL